MDEGQGKREVSEIVLRQKVVQRGAAGKIAGGSVGGGHDGDGLRPPATQLDIQASRDHVPRELTPNELLQGVVSEDAKQNQRLTAKLNGAGGGGGGFGLPGPPFKKIGDAHGQRDSGAKSGDIMRFIVCTLGVTSLAFSQMSRMVLNQTITEMVEKTAKKEAVSSDGSCPWPEELKAQMEFGPSTLQPGALVDFGATTTSAPPESPTTTEIATTIATTTTTTELVALTTEAAAATEVAGTTLRPAPPSPPSTTVRLAPRVVALTTRDEATTAVLNIEVVDERELPDLASAKPGNDDDDDGGGDGDDEDDRNLEELPDFEDEELGTTVASERDEGTTPGERADVPFARTSEASTEVAWSGSTRAEFTSSRPPAETTPDTAHLYGDPDDPSDELSVSVSHSLSAASDAEPSSSPPPPSLYPRYNWTMKQQSTLLGGFYYSYFLFMVLGGRLAEIYGAKYVLLLSVGGSALINLATPWMARTSFTLLVISRMIMGAIQAGVFPGMYALIAKWLTMTEASIYAPLIKMMLRLGMMLGSLLPGIVCGWPSVFYLTGILSALWSLAWLALATSDPADNKWVSRAELAHINRKKRPRETASKGALAPALQAPLGLELADRKQSAASGASAQAAAAAAASPHAGRRKSTPWLKIITAPSVIGLIVVKLTFNYALDFLAIELPSYLSYVHHVGPQTISAITSAMFCTQVVLIVFVGWLAKSAVQRRPFGLDKTGVRKLFQGLASFGLSLSFFLLTFNNCNLLYVNLLLHLSSLLSMFTAGGETMLPYDLSLEYPATIMAIANSVANLSGVTTTTVAGLVLGNQGASYERWNVLIYLIAGANLVGGLAFMLLVKAEPIDFGGGERDLEEAAGKPNDKERRAPQQELRLGEMRK